MQPEAEIWALGGDIRSERRAATLPFSVSEQRAGREGYSAEGFFCKWGTHSAAALP